MKCVVCGDEIRGKVYRWIDGTLCTECDEERTMCEPDHNTHGGEA